MSTSYHNLHLSSFLPALLITSALTALIFVVIKYLRYFNSREIILNTFSYIQGVKTQWVRDPQIAQKILVGSEHKGKCLEHLISCTGWLPILSMESVDGEQWRRMKTSFLTLRTHLPSLEDLSLITKDNVQAFLDTGTILDSRALVNITIKSMVKWLFRKEFSPDWEFVVEASWEWRKELAIRGEADVALKRKTVEWMKEMIKSSAYYEIFGQKWNDPEYFSLLLQPFIISPAINIADIAVTLNSKFCLERLKEIGQPDPQKIIDCGAADGLGLNDYIVYAINISHPFPVLERWFPDGLRNHHTGEVMVEPNTQVFMPMDEIGASIEFGQKGNVMAFGGGKRACAGRDIAMAMCVPLFSKVLFHPQFKPELNHLYSGRNNDLKESWSQSFFQVKVLVHILWKLLKNKFSYNVLKV